MVPLRTLAAALHIPWLLCAISVPRGISVVADSKGPTCEATDSDDSTCREKSIDDAREENGEIEGSGDVQEAEVNSKCTLYLAESTIPNAGMGMFTGVDLSGGKDISDGDICIPNIDLDWSNGDELDFWLWSDYDWLAPDLGEMANEARHEDDVRGACPGFGAAINCHSALTNVMESAPKVDNAGLHRGKDPGVGAFTPYHNRRVRAGKDTPAGAELFVNYGEDWFKTREYIYGKVPFRRNYAKANKLLRKYDMVKNKISPTITNDMQHDLWYIITHLPYESRTINALPKSTADIQNATQEGTANILLAESMRSVDWLEKNGKCLDNIRPGNSTIKQAGRGAFATRLIPKGSLVTTAPLIHIPHADVLNRYDEIYIEEEDRYDRNMSSPRPKQMLLNYCFGHRNSTLLLSPYGHHVTLINHNSASPNAKIVWADENMLNHNPDWFNVSVNELGDREYAGLVFDFIATRDILSGEEVFIDYGPEWEEAWNKHASTWIPLKGSEKYAPASIWNHDYDTELKTMEEQAIDPYPDNVGIECLPSARARDFSTKNWETQRNRLKIQHRFPLRTSSHECNITKREVLDDGRIVYTADAVSNDEDKSPNVTKYVLSQVPREAFMFVDQPYSSDSNLINAFRHEIMIPDEIFPKAWMNKN